MAEPNPVPAPVRRTHHGWHFALSVLTCGLWLPVWAYFAWLNHGPGKTADYSSAY